MKIDELRIYAEVLEQGLDFKEYLLANGADFEIKNIYAKKARSEITSADSLVDRIRKSKDVDVLLTAISGNNEFPLLMVEYSTAVPTDDHKMQRSDVYFWGAIYKVPILKISPNNKGMEQDFGGGDKFSDEHEIILAHRIGAIFYPVTWNCIDGKDILDANPSALSCINRDENIAEILNGIINCFQSAFSYKDWYRQLQEEYEKKYAAVLAQNKELDTKSLIVDSKRFKWTDEKLVAKINRFGHAMDPDRGVLYFVNMLVGLENTIAEIQINRPDDFNARGGYKSLFDQAAHEEELSNYVKNLIASKNNIFTSDDALYILTLALTLPQGLIRKKDNRNYFIENNDLYKFLINSPNMVAKSIFFLSTCLILSDKNRNEICRISWNVDPIKKYYKALPSANYRPISLSKLTMKDAKEDIITFASTLLYKKMNCELLAVSYPGAQGDRCILTGQGRKILRTYVDIIACQRDGNQFVVYLEECKDNIDKTKDDDKKLNKIKNDTTYNKGLRRLCKKLTGTDSITTLLLSLGAKSSRLKTIFNVDYIFMFEIDETEKKFTRINYAIAFINTKIAQRFSSLLDSNGRAKGSIDLAQIYTIKQQD